ncbi:hypothetical protein OG897_24960 [Streptomyces sp. NBC_00237]|uniref:hypothetical protein n=1 Tax=Streptomyces sp. NBC_00237 TaxID=2975687 RepID=UPI00224FC902|nr:hypothetical protein [Streptomyces sp. NBC_00237]MCX5204692.1 hypothetical protein [Streptomyces sp. NBC_00237]
MRVRGGAGKVRRASPGAGGGAGGGRAPGEPGVGAIVVFVLLILLFACEVFLGGPWLTEVSVTVLSGIFVVVAGALLAPAFVSGGPSLRTLTVATLVLVVVVAVALVSVGTYVNSKDEDVTEGVKVAGKPGEMINTDGLTLTVPITRERDRLRLRVAGRDLPNGGSPCLPEARLTVSGAQSGDRQVRFARGVAAFDLPLRKGKKEVSVQIRLTTEESCRISLEIEDAVLTNDTLPEEAA